MASLFSPLNYDLGEFEVTADTISQIYPQFGTLNPGVNTTHQLKIYDLGPLVANSAVVDSTTTRYQITIRTFSHEYDPEKGIFPLPQKLKKYNYRSGHVWIYEPRVLYGSFEDASYTRIWRIYHELGHGIVEPFLFARYGDSKRLGQMGKISKDIWMNKEVTLQPISLRHAQRSIEWESLAFRAQRMLLSEAGVQISDDEYQREYNINISDAIFRAITGKFGRPGAYGLIPHNRDIDLHSILWGLEHAAHQIPMSQDIRRNVLSNIPELDDWYQIPDDSLLEAVETCADRGLSHLHTNWKQFDFYDLDRL